MPEATISHNALRFEVNPDNGSFRVHLGTATLSGRCHAELSAGNGKVVRTSGGKPVSILREPVTDVHGKGERLIVEYGAASGLVLSLEAAIYASQPFVAIRLGAANPGPETLSLHRLTPLSTNSLDFGSGPLDGWVNGYHSWCFAGFVRHYWQQPHAVLGWLTAPMSRNIATRNPRGTGSYVGEEVAALMDGDRQALVAGFIGLADQFGQVYADGRPGSKSLTLQTTADGIPLDPGETLWGEWAILYCVELPDGDPLYHYTKAVTRLTPGRVPPTPPQPGWSSWYQFFAAVDAEDMARNQRALFELRERLPLGVIQLDDGYQPTWGDWLRHNEKFPEGVAAWAKGVHDDGFTPGLWLSPFTVDRKSAIFRERPEAVVRDQRGRPAHAGFLLNRWIMGLDPTHPATQDYVRKVVSTVVHEWGIPYLKLDYLYCGALPGLRHDPRRTRAQALRDGMKLIREAAGEEATIIGCGCPAGPAIGLVDIMRIGPDCAPNWYPRLFGLERPLRHDPCLSATRNAIRNSLSRGFTHRQWWWLDADNLLVREEQLMSPAEVQSYVSVMGLTGSAMMLSDDLPKLSEERLRWAASLLPVLPGGCQAPGLFTEELPDTLIRRFEGATGEWLVVGLFNWDDQPDHRLVSLTDLGLPARTPVLACDFWKRRVSIEQDTLLTDLLLPHGAALMALRAVTAEAQFAGSDLHFSMGGEVGEWQVRKNEVCLTVDLGRRAEGTIWLRLPTPPKGATCNGQPVTITPAESADLYAIPTSVEQKAALAVKL